MMTPTRAPSELAAMSMIEASRGRLKYWTASIPMETRIQKGSQSQAGTHGHAILARHAGTAKRRALRAKSHCGIESHVMPKVP